MGLEPVLAEGRTRDPFWIREWEEESRQWVGEKELIDWNFVSGGVQALIGRTLDCRRLWRMESKNWISVGGVVLVWEPFEG